MKHSFTEIDCTEFKSVLIVGKDNNDPRSANAVGKTTIFVAIEYVLFDVTPFSQLDKIVRHDQDRCKVTFDFESNGTVYRISRSRNKRTSKSEVRMYRMESDWVDITQKTASETNEELNRLIKITHMAFRNSIHFAQMDLHGLASATPRERKAMLKEPLQISIYSKLEKIAKEKAALISKELDKTKILIQSLGRPEEEVSTLQLELINLEHSITENTKLNLSLQQVLDNKNIEYSDLKKVSVDDLLVIKSSILALETDKNKCLVKKASIESNDILVSNELKKLNTQQVSLKKDLEQSNNTKENLSKVIFRAINDIVEEKNKILTKELDGTKYLARLESEKQRLSKVLPDGDTCSHCDQVVPAQYRKEHEKQRLSELSVIESDRIKYNKLLQVVKSKKTMLEQELTSAQLNEKQMVDILHLISNKELLIKQCNQNIEVCRDKQASIKNELIESIEMFDKLTIQISVLQEELHNKSSLNVLNKIQQTENEIKEIKSKIDSGVKEINKSNTLVGMITGKLNQCESNKEESNKLKSQLLIMEKDLSIKTKVTQAFSSSGIPTMIINTILDDLQTVANNLLKSLKPGMELFFSIVRNKLDGQQEDTLDIVYCVNGRELEYQQLSGAQKFLVSLSLKLGMSLIIQHRIGVDIKFLFLDEVDQSLDPKTIDAFMDVIKNWQEKFTIFVITHNDSLKEKFTHAILIEEDGVNGSSGKVVTSW